MPENAQRVPREPAGKPIPGVTTRNDAEWALTKARRFIFRGGEWSPTLRAYVDRWLDFLRGLERDCGR